MYEYEKESFAEGKDILYRQWLSTPKKWTGWKSFRKACKNGNPPWPWDYPVPTEWKVKEYQDSDPCSGIACNDCYGQACEHSR